MTTMTTTTATVTVTAPTLADLRPDALRAARYAVQDAESAALSLLRVAADSPELAAWALRQAPERLAALDAARDALAAARAR